MDNDNLLYSGRGIARGENGSEIGNVTMDVPVQNYVLWGQRVEIFARKTGFAEIAGAFNVTARFWRSSETDPDLGRKLEAGEVEGDSFLSGPDTLQPRLIVSGVVHEIRLIRNKTGRLAGFEFGPIDAPSGPDALSAGEMVLGLFERGAALSGVPLFCPVLRATRSDLAESRQSIVLPYPDVQISPPEKSKFPLIDVLFATLAEGRRATSVFYRALVFFKIVDTFIERIQPKLNRVCYDNNMPFDQLDLAFPEIPFHQISPPLVGVKYTAYRDRVRNRIRDVVAHLDPDSPIIPFDVAAEIEVRTASIALHYCASEVVTFVYKCVERLAQKDLALAQGLTYPIIDKRRKRYRQK